MDFCVLPGGTQTLQNMQIKIKEVLFVEQNVRVSKILDASLWQRKYEYDSLHHFETHTISFPFQAIFLDF